MSTTVSNDGSDVSIERPALCLVATPIGNLGDISARALQVLSTVDLVLAEDTRISAKLLQRYGIETEMRALHDHNERLVAESIIDDVIARNLAIAQISDAGTPSISDPGYALVRAAIAKGVAVTTLPGACAAIAALSLSGLATDQFTFIGFLNAKSSARQKALASLRQERRTLIFYESPHRISDTLLDLYTIFGAERRAVIARELTKKFETVYRGTMGELVTQAKADRNISKGEIVIVVEGSDERDSDQAREAKRVLEILLRDLSVSQAVKLAAQISGAKKNWLYQMANQLSSKR